MNLSLEEKNAVICGSSQGIGLAIAQELAALGANCILIARNEKKLEEAIRALPQLEYQKHSFRVADFINPDEVRNAIDEILKTQKVHVLINNSGGPAAGIISEAKEEQFINAFNQHLINNHILATAVLPGMKEDGYGRIINILSTSVKIPMPSLGVSGTIRAAVAAWAKMLSHDVGQFNITVNNILPGYTETERLQEILTTNAKKKNEPEEKISEAMLKDIPMRRFGKASEIAAVAAFLASPAASYVTGVSIPIDGGRTGAI